MMLRSILQNLEADILQALPTVLSLRQEFEYKPDGSPVSKGDIFLENLIISFFKVALPQHRIIGEESFVDFDYDLDLQNVIYVDPIDGTENFVSGLREWGVGVSIVSDGHHQCSLLMLPELGDCFITGDKQVTYTASRICGLSSSLSGAQIADITRDKLAKYEYRIIGCAMYNLLSAAQGSFHIFENINGVSCWDLMPGINICLEHGRNVEIDGQPYTGQPLRPGNKYRVKIS